ncbi:MAG: hypothetical protein QQN41_04065 [Nitrosopumilus sp.]
MITYIIIADATFADNPKIWTVLKSGFWCFKNFPQSWHRIKRYKTLAGAQRQAKIIHKKYGHVNVRVANWKDILSY